ncbi:tetratricopeptide repeat protein [Acetobacter orientalis]|uniref:Tetratricopeptide repeat family protein n=1 Tax=Acetobacter orientalis TaxID=146474 RepID=A0A2Z5ZLX8_9PROT|nr:tetratricopeptide repeat protein [Acetobacter orientalis]BBC81339.1 tetratricopeptide repeat family protein [Acetobacter orientalis]GAN67079.1 hypothetical protein Abor_037_025 [Acetobacter orientalis]GBR20624.1 tetratricopeptide repeat family protein [Acetobacter orientalis NRIC 0481]GEL60503.1 hypothetical protein AOR02nite_03450 [Acetobacter orientalis]
MTLHLDYQYGWFPLSGMTHPVVSFVRGSALCMPLWLGLSLSQPVRAYALPQGGKPVRMAHAHGRGNAPEAKVPAPVWSEQACNAMVGEDPFGARDYAQDWLKHDGGRAAQHCLALAQIELGDEQTAAQTLDDLARKEPFTGPLSSASQRVVIAVEAAQAWLAASLPTNAVSIAQYGLSIRPGDEGLTLVKARAELALNDPASVLKDVGALVAQTPNVGVDAYVLLASAERRLGQLQQASVHVAKALDRAPENPEALLERGIIRGQRGDSAGAREDWQHVLDLAPDTHAADMARQDLAVQAADPDVP